RVAPLETEDRAIDLAVPSERHGNPQLACPLLFGVGPLADARQPDQALAAFQETPAEAHPEVVVVREDLVPRQHEVRHDRSVAEPGHDLSRLERLAQVAGLPLASRGQGAGNVDPHRARSSALASCCWAEMAKSHAAW